MPFALKNPAKPATRNLADRNFALLAFLGMFAVALLCAASARTQGQAPQTGMPEGTPRSWAEAAANNELGIIDAEGSFPVRYRIRKVDAKGDTTREVIESKDGTVARMVERNGQPLTAEEDAGERERLNEVLSSPDEFLRHQHRSHESREYSKQLVRLLPSAMIYSYVPGQPQSNAAKTPQVVMDFRPDPAFKPPTMIANVLTGIEGRVWIDTRSRHMTRVETHVIRPVNFGLGVIAHIYPGGTVLLEQARAGDDRWVYAHMEEHLTVRELMLRTVAQNTVMTSWDFRLLPSPMTYQDAVHTLLALPVTLRPGN
jgi:hypothetical protein